MPDITNFEDLDSLSKTVKKVEVSTDNGTTWGTLWQSGRLPAGYTELKYIESTGTQWINTNIMPDAEKVFDFDLQFELTSRTAYANVLTSQASGSNLYITRLNGDTDQFMWYCASSTSQYILNPISYNTKYTMLIHYESGQNSLTIPDLVTKTSTNTLVTTTSPFIICSNRPTSASAYPAKMKVYGCQISIDNVVARFFVPCKNSNDIAGLYDLVNNIFYTSAGSSDFIASPAS